MSAAPSHITDINGYIFFSPQTLGHFGKPIKIHASLLVDFLLSVDPKTGDGQAVIRDIESLRAFANTDVGGIRPPHLCKNDSQGHKEQLSKVHQKLNATVQGKNIKRERPFQTKNVKVFYHINQNPGDSYPTVYINEIQVRVKNVTHAGGMYEVTVKSTGASVDKKDRLTLDGRAVYISAAESSPDHAIDQARKATKLRNPVLFFVPEQAAESLTAYRDNRSNEAAQKLTHELADIIQKNAAGKVHWTVEGEGASLLQRALKNVSASLKTHSFKFINAQGNLPNLIQNLKEKSADMSGDFMKIDYARRQSAVGALVSTLRCKNALMSQLIQVPASQSKIPAQGAADSLTRLAMLNELGGVMNQSKINQIVALPQALRGNKITFVEALTRVRG